MNLITVARAAIMSLLSLTIVTVVGYAQGKADNGLSSQGSAPPQALLFDEEKAVRLAYMKLMLYNKAASADRAAQTKTALVSDDYVRFEIRNVHIGPIEEINDRPYTDLVSPARGDILLVVPDTISHNNGPRYASYNAGWIDAGSIYHTAAIDNSTVREALAKNASLADVGKYASYEVVVHLSGKERLYRAMFLYHGPLQSAATSNVEILDNVAGSFALARALSEHDRPMKAPWGRYVNSDEYRQHARAPQAANAKLGNGATFTSDDRSAATKTSGDEVGFSIANLEAPRGDVGLRRDELHTSFFLPGSCPVGFDSEFIVGLFLDGMCCNGATLECCLPTDPTFGFTSDISCPTPTPQPIPAPNTGVCNCTEGTEYFNPKQIGFDDFTKHFPNGTRHSGWMQTQGHCDTLCSCAINCAVDPWGNPPNGVWDDGKDTTWDGLNHVPTPQTTRQTATANKGGTATCGFAFGVGWVACADTTCTANVTFSWSGISYSINSTGFYTGALQDTLTCKSPSP